MDDCGELPRAGDWLGLLSLEDGCCEKLGAWLVCVFRKDGSKLGEGYFGEVGGCGLAVAGVESEIEWAVCLEGEAAFRVVDLHGGNAKVCDDDIEACELFLSEQLGETGEVHVLHLEGLRSVACVT